MAIEEASFAYDVGGVIVQELETNGKVPAHH
jgi:hypothetical protein